MEEIIANFSSRQKSDILLSGKFLLLLHLLLTDAAVEDGGMNTLYPLIHKAKSFINQNYSRDITSEDVAKYLGMSESHLRAKFKKIYGITMHRYLCDTRLAAAKQKLSNTTESVSEIADKCGFSSLEYFINFFRKETGMSPRTWRKNAAEHYYL